MMDTTSSSGEFDEADTEYCARNILDGKERNVHASEWKKEDLESLNIFYERSPDSLTDFVARVQKDYVDKYSVDTQSTMRNFSELLKDNLDFSIDLEDIYWIKLIGKTGQLAVKEEEITKKIKECSSNITEVTKQTNSPMCIVWSEYVCKFLRNTQRLVQRVCHTKQETLKVMKIEQGRERYGKRKRTEVITKKLAKPEEKIYEDVCRRFLDAFLLSSCVGETRRKFIGHQFVSSKPDLEYYVEDLNSTNQNRLLFVKEVKKFPATIEMDRPLEEQLPPCVLGDVASGLLTDVSESVFWPNSLAVILMETKMIFVFMEMTEEHLVAIVSGKKPEKRIRIHYTNAFDILKAADRAQCADFLFWLGCVQNPPDSNRLLWRRNIMEEEN